MKSLLKKITIYSAVYFLVTLLLSPNELFCSFNLNEMCIASIVGKWILFIIIMFLYDKFLKPLFSKKIDKQ
mgnify:CR=1 FL=1